MEAAPAAGRPIGADTLYDGAPCGLLVTDTDGLIRRVNRTFCVWAGREPAELIGQMKVQDFLSIGGRMFHQTHWGPLMQIQGSVSEVKLELVHRDGRKLPTVWNAVRRVHDETPVHEIAVFIAEDRHKYEQELLLARRQAEALLEEGKATEVALGAAHAERDRQQALAEDRALFAEQMVAIVSHDLRNPLSVIRMSSHVLGVEGLPPKQQPALARILRATERATRLIADLLDFSSRRLGTGLRVVVEPIEVHALVAHAVDDLLVAHPGHAIEHRKVGEGACLGNADRISQLIGNLVVNAMTYGAPDRPVVVTSTIAEHDYSVSVHNEGRAIPETLRPRLFDPMSRGIAAGGQVGSVGLGLFIVREIARAHGGEAAVTSSITDGTTFGVTLPRIGPDADTSATQWGGGFSGSATGRG